MTVDITPPGVVYFVTESAPGVEYPLPFPYIQTTDIKAYISKDGKKTALPNGAGFQVVDQTFTTLITLPLYSTLVIYRETALTQEILWVDGQAVHPPSIMKGDDKLTLIVQELANAVDRSIKVEREDADDKTAEELLPEIFAIAERAEDAADKADSSLQKILGILPIPSVYDNFKILSVVVIDGKAHYSLLRTGGGGGGGGGEGSGYVDYVVPVTDATGRVVVTLDGLGHPTELGLFNPIITLLTAEPYYMNIIGRSDTEFIVQIYKPGGIPGVDIALCIELGTFELGDGTELGMSGTGANVTLLVSLPI